MQEYYENYCCYSVSQRSLLYLKRNLISAGAVEWLALLRP